MKKPKTSRRKVATGPSAPPAVLFDRIVGILEQARAGVVRAVNSHMVLAYWLIGREIVQEIQGGKGRAAYGEAVLTDLSEKLTARYGGGFSETTLKHFRTFYLVYGIRHPLGDESKVMGALAAISRPMGAELGAPTIRHPAGSESLSGFSPQLSWSHYRSPPTLAGKSPSTVVWTFSKNMNPAPSRWNRRFRKPD